MKVRTNLKAGNLIDDLNREAALVTDVVNRWYNEASRRVSDVGQWTEAQVKQIEDLGKRLMSL